jgi:nicotinate-nucleotide adenylyltransferase
MCYMVANFFPGPQVGVSHAESTLKGTSWTIRTLKYLIKKRPDCEFSLLLGADAYAEHEKWKDFDAITRLVPIISPGRGDFESDAPVLSGVSSTQIRRMVREGRDISMLVPERVGNYILEKGLYKP